MCIMKKPETPNLAFLAKQLAPKKTVSNITEQASNSAHEPANRAFQPNLEHPLQSNQSEVEPHLSSKHTSHYVRLSRAKASVMMDNRGRVVMETREARAKKGVRTRQRRSEVCSEDEVNLRASGYKLPAK